MQVKSQPDILGADKFRDTISGFLRDVSVRTARICAVDVARFGAGQALAGGIVHIDVRIRPLVDRIRGSGAEAECAGPALGLQCEILHIALAGVVVGHAAAVGIRDDKDGTLIYLGILNESERGHKTGRLISVRAAKDQHLSAGFTALKDIDRRIGMSAFEPLEPVGEHLDLRDAGALYRHGQLAGFEEVRACYTADRDRRRKA